jgi:hypothetical protein
MADGHCATTSEVIFVEFSAGGCAGADGSSAKPYCAPNDGVAAMTVMRHVIVIRGAASSQMTLSTTTGVSPIVIGRQNSSAVAGSIPATAATAITVSSDSVLIRDLTVNAGTTPTSRGIAATGSGTKLTLLRVTASLGTGTLGAGLGVDAESGATLTMNHCTVTNNSAGGILLDGAAFDIENTTVTNNGPGTQGAITWGGILVNNPPASGSKTLNLLTVQNNMGGGVACSAAVSSSATGVLASSNTVGLDVNTTCGFSSCGAASMTCGAQP